MACGFFRTVRAAVVWLVLTSVAFAQAPPSAARFDISGYAVEGAPLLRAEDFSRIVAPFIGKQKTAADVQKAQQALQQAYLDLGHCSVQVTVPKAQPDAGTVTLRLVQSPVPVSRDCLPMVVLDDKRAPPVPVAPGEVAVRPLADVTQAAGETPPQSEAPTQIARAPLKPLQDRPPSIARPSVPPPEVAVAPAPSDTPADVSVKSLAQAPPQPGLIVTPSPPVAVEKPVVTVPSPPTAIASAPVVTAPQPKPEIAPAQPELVVAPPSPPSTEKPAVTPPPAPAAIASAPVVAAPQPKPEIAPAPAQPELLVAPPSPPSTEKPAVTPPPAPAAIASAPAAPVQQPKPEIALAPAPPKLVLSPPTVAPIEPVKPTPPAPAIVAAMPAPKPQPAVEQVQEQKPEIAAVPPTPPVIAEKPAAKPAPEIIAAAPVQPEPVKPEPSAGLPPVPAPAPIPAIAAEPQPKPAPVPKPIVETVKEQVAVPTDVAPAMPVSPAPAARPVEKPAPDAVATALIPKVVKPVVPAEIPGPVAPSRVVEAAPKVEPEPIRPPSVIAVAPLPQPAPEPKPIVEPVKEQVAAKPEAASISAAPPVTEEKPVAKPVQEMITAAPANPEPAKSEPGVVVSAPANVIPETISAPSVVVAEPASPAPAVAAAVQPEPQPAPKQPAVIEPAKEQIPAKPEVVAVPTQPPVVADRPVKKPVPDVIAIAPKPDAATPAIAPAPVITPPAPVAAPRVEEVAPKIVVEPAQPASPPPVVAAVPQPEPVIRPQPVTEPAKEVAAKTEAASVPMSAASPVVAEKPASPEDVVVRPLARIEAPAPEPREPAEVKSEVERAPVRQLQDRVAVQEQASTRVGDAPEPQTTAKPPSVVGQAPAVPSAPAETAAPADTTAAALKFDIDRYLVEGNTLLNADAISRVLSAYTGKQKDFADVQRALEALQIAYQKAGWGAVQVTLPEQELERGEVRFEVTETRIGKIEVQGNEYFSEANVRRSVPSLKPGETPNSIAIARSLKVANENPAKQSQVSLKAGSKDGEVDATIKVVDDNPRKYSVSLDNTGTASTGQLRLGFGFQNSNLWGRDHQFTFQYITNPDHINKVTVLGLGYHVPLYDRGDSIDLILGYSDVDSGTVQQLFNVSGAGLIALGRYNHYLRRIGDYEQKITFGIDYKAFQNRVLIGNAALVPDITLHPVSLSYSGELRKDENAFNFYTSVTYNPFEGGNDAAQSDFRASRGSGGGASAEYVIWRYGLNYQRLLPDDWTLRFALNGQTTRNALVAGEQFGLGGANSVRGFNERTYSNDKGHQATLEVYTPDIANKIGFESGRLKLLAFYDTGTLGRNFLQVGEQTGLSVDSLGLGLRLTFRDKFNLRMDYAQVLHDGGQDAGIRDGRRNSNTLHASAVFVY